MLQKRFKNKPPFLGKLCHHMLVLGICPEVFMTPGSGSFSMAQADIQTHTHTNRETWQLYDRPGPRGQGSEKQRQSKIV